MTRDQLFDLMRPIVMQLTGVAECILADDNEDAPGGEYAVIEPMVSITYRGAPRVVRSALGASKQVRVDVRPQVIADCSVQFYRGDAQNRASRLKRGTRVPSVYATMYAAGVGWWGSGAVNNLNSIQSNNVESRAQVTIRLAYEQVDVVEDVNNIEVIPPTTFEDFDHM